MKTEKLIVRNIKSKTIGITMLHLAKAFSFFSVNDKPYFGRITPDESLNEYCTCADFVFRNDDFMAKHNTVLQCKHMIAAKKLRGWWKY